MDDMMNLDGSGWDESMFDDVLGEVAEKVRLLVFIVDCSGSMEGTTIGSVNSIMEEVLSDLEKDKDYKRIAVLTYGKEVTWMCEPPVEFKDYGGWQRLHVSALSHLGDAVRELGKKLRQKEWCPSGKNGTEGVFVLFSDGMATDQCEDGLKFLQESPIFRNGKRIAVNFSEFRDMDVLTAFTGNRENVLNLKSNEKSKAQKRILEIARN